jgi:hypothetical protein
MDEDAEAPRRGWRAFVGPVILSTWKRRYYRGLLVLWLILAVAAVVTGRFALLWIPLVGTAGTGLLLLRDRAGRQG